MLTPLLSYVLTLAALLSHAATLTRAALHTRCAAPTQGGYDEACTLPSQTHVVGLCGIYWDGTPLARRWQSGGSIERCVAVW